MNANIGYELSEDLPSSRKLKFINTTDSNSTPQEVNLTGNELNSGVRNLAALTNAPTLIHNKTYTIEINGNDAAGNVATTASVTGLKYEVPSTKLTSLNITDNSDVTLSGFTFDSDTLTYNLLTKLSTVKISYQEVSANIDPTTVTDGSNADISSDLSSLTLTTGNNVVKITITSRFAGISSTTYTLNINFDNVPPTINNLQPVQDSFIMNANIGYQLSENLASGKVKFINTTDNTQQEVNLTGNELSSGIRSLAALTNVPTLIDGKTYTIEINGTDLVGNDAATASVTGLKYEIPSTKLTSLNITDNSDVTLSGFTFNKDTLTYNLVTKLSTVKISYQEVSSNIDSTTVTDGSNADISSDLSSLTLTSGNNVVKITINSGFAGTPPTTYTININLDDVLPIISNLQPGSR